MSVCVCYLLFFVCFLSSDQPSYESAAPYVSSNCSLCRIPMMPRQKHCHECNKCVPEFDHHWYRSYNSNLNVKLVLKCNVGFILCVFFVLGFILCVFFVWFEFLCAAFLVCLYSCLVLEPSMWLNGCVGGRNYALFFALLSITTLMFVLQTVMVVRFLTRLAGANGANSECLVSPLSRTTHLVLTSVYVN